MSEDPNRGVPGEAMAVAFVAHRGQVDKLGLPYFGHVRRVALAVEGDDARTVAWLHDVLEDCPEWTADRLVKRFPFRIVEAVVAISRGRDEGRLPYLRRVKENPLALVVKIADLRDNLREDRARLVLNHKGHVYRSALAFLTRTRPTTPRET